LPSKTKERIYYSCPAEKKENAIKWQYTNAKRCAVRTGTRSVCGTRTSRLVKSREAWLRI
jgi:hypothetical protein